MGQTLDIDDLVTAGVIVVRMGLSGVYRVHQLMETRTPMPGPVYTGPRILLWHWPAVSAWAAETGREAIDPNDWVATGDVTARLGLSAQELDDLGQDASRSDPDGAVSWRWRDVETLWIEVTNRGRR